MAGAAEMLYVILAISLSSSSGGSVARLPGCCSLKLPHRRHGQAPKPDHKVYRPVSNLRILQFPQVGIGIGDDIEFVVSRDAIKFQLHRRKIAVQNQLSGVGIEKIDVQVVYRVFIRRACLRTPSARPVRA